MEAGQGELHSSDDENGSLSEANVGMSSFESSASTVAAIVEQVTHSDKQLTKVVLSDSSLTLARAQPLFDGLCSNNVVIALDLSNNLLGDGGTAALVTALQSNSSVHMLDLGGNKVTDVGAGVLGDMLKTNTSLTELKLSTNAISDQGIFPLSAALKTNTTLLVLHLKDNRIGDNGVVALAEMLQDNNTLSELELYGNGSQDDDVIAIADMLDMDLSINSIGDKGAIALAKVLAGNCALAELGLGKNSINNAGVVALAEMLEQNTTLAELDLGDNEINDEGVQGLANMLKHNTTLAELDLSYNDISDDGGNLLAAALKENARLNGNDSLTELHLDGCDISDLLLNDIEVLLNHQSEPSDDGKYDRMDTPPPSELSEEPNDEKAAEADSAPSSIQDLQASVATEGKDTSVSEGVGVPAETEIKPPADPLQVQSTEAAADPRTSSFGSVLTSEDAVSTTSNGSSNTVLPPPPMRLSSAAVPISQASPIQGSQPVPLIDVTVEQVFTLVHSIRLSQFAQVMLENEVSGDTLDCCEEADELEDLGINKSIFRRQLFRRIVEFKEHGVPVDFLNGPSLSRQSMVAAMPPSTPSSSAASLPSPSRSV